MRYSMLVYVAKMCRTLQEAADYLKTAPEGGLRSELLENGRQMLGQIRDVLEGHRDDLHSEAPLVRLAEIEALWDSCGEGLEKRLEQFIQELPGQVTYQVRAVFFAELGEKWDAMESVYEYMRDDSRFDPVVVRTPVGRVVNRNGKREQEIIYKDFLTPTNIPSLGYDQYDIEMDCPEIAFISQPYESCTLAQFWPENIAKYTRLVYLPYFIPYQILSDAANTLCKLPVYRLAWKVAGMSENHYHFYAKYALNGGANMMMTGLPKFDSFVKLRSEACALPDSWKVSLAGRKGILWNTWYDYRGSSISYFDRLVAWFKANEDFTLIWRPHPMTDTVTKLYCSDDVYQQYRRYIQTARSTPNIILDEEVSCRYAFCHSVAMISDDSSLIPQYLMLNKPVLFTSTGSDTQKREDGRYLIDPSWMENAERFEDVTAFLQRIQLGQDLKKNIRQSVLCTALPLADGRSGERVCETVWHDMHTENLL